MTQDIDERAKINTSRSVAAMIAIGIINIITVPLVSKPGSRSAKDGYLFVAIIYGCIFAACHFFCFAKTKETVATPEKEKYPLKYS
jgi:Na+/melibiose symporter-like transporter